MAEEIWEQSEQQVDVFVQSVGTAQCIKGVAGALREAKQPFTSKNASKRSQGT
jgi:cysteine synthase